MENMRRAAATRRQVLAGLAGSLALGLAGRARADQPMLRIGDQKGGAQSVMQAAGVLDDLPYRLTWNQFPAAAPVLEALNAGAVDASIAGDAPTMFALAAGLPGRVIAPIRTTGAGTAIMVRADSPIHSVLDLKAHSIGTNRGSIGHALVLALMQQQGWGPGDIRINNLLPAEAKTALSAGSVDAWSSWGVYVAQARLVDHARVVVDSSKGLLSGLSYLIASTDAIGHRRDALLDFSRRLARARRWASAHPDAYARVLAAEIGVTEPVARLSIETDAAQPVAIDDGVIADAQKTADLFVAAKVIHERLDVRPCFDASFNQALAG